MQSAPFKTALAAIAACILLSPTAAHAVLTKEDLTLQKEDKIEEGKCNQAWPVDCSKGSGGVCGGWKRLKDLAQSETLPGDNYASCSSGVRLSMGDKASQGQPVGAMFPGTVIYSQAGRSRDGRDYGGVVVIKLNLDDGSPQCFARYMFLDRRDLVRTGQEVKPGQRIGSVASDDMSVTKHWWKENWGANFPAQVKIDIGCDEALANLPMFMPREAFKGGGPEDANSCPLTKMRFPARPLEYLVHTPDGDNTGCHVGVRKDARSEMYPAEEQDDTELNLKVTGDYVETVKPRGVIKRKETPVFAVFSDPVARDELYGANKERTTGGILFRDHTNYPQATTLRCENMQELFRGRENKSLTPAQVRELLAHCTNQYILGRSLFTKVFEQSTATATAMQKPLPYRLRDFMEPEDKKKYNDLLAAGTPGNEVFEEMEPAIVGVFWRDLCQPLKMQKVHFKDYKPKELLSKAWTELLIDWPKDQKLEPINRRPMPAIDINQYTEYPYERINDPSNPFSPRQIFAETERERYSNYRVQCAATPVDIILGTYGEKEPFDTYGKRDKSFHQCIRCRIELNETKEACFADPWSFTNSGGCATGMGAEGGTGELCDNLDQQMLELLDQLEHKYGLRPKLLHAVATQESGCRPVVSSPAGAQGMFQFMPSTAAGWVDPFGHPDPFDPNDPIVAAEHSAQYYSREAAHYPSAPQRCNLAYMLAAYNCGPGCAGDHINEISQGNFGGLPEETQGYIKNITHMVGGGNDGCGYGGPFPKGNGSATGTNPGDGGGGGGGFGGSGDVFGGGSGNSGPAGTNGRPLGIQLVIGAMKHRGEPYSNQNPNRYQLDGGVADCSGLVAKGFHEATGKSMLDEGIIPVSTEIEKWVRAHGGKNLTREQAMNTPGAMMSINGLSAGYVGLGAMGHIGYSVGDGKTAFETASAEGHKAGCSPFDYNSWTDYFQFPDNMIDYDPERNKPIPNMCDMIFGGAQGICRFALPANIMGQEDLEPPKWLTQEEYKFPKVEMPKPLSEKRGDKFDLEEDGMVYEGAWKACKNLPGDLREVCKKLNETEGSETDAAGGTPMGSNSGFINPQPCGPITSPFGTRVHPISGEVKFHQGIDIGVGAGLPIFAAGDGIVEAVMPEATSGGWGNFVVIRHADGTKTEYAHQSAFCPQTKVGSPVVQGQVIGLVGTTGNSTGPHLHFNVKKPGYVDPTQFVPAQTPGAPQCAQINSYTCGQTITGQPVGPGVAGGTGKTICVDKPCTLRYDEADVVAQCGFPVENGGCGTLGHFSQRSADDTGDCCFNITAPVTPLNVLKIRPGYDKEALKPGAVNVEQFIGGAWEGKRPDDGLPNGLNGEGGNVPLSAKNPGAPEGYTFHEYFRDHRPYMRWWDTGAESGNIVQETTDADSIGGSFDALVGVGIEKDNCGIGGWGDPKKLDGNTSWMELKLYQSRSQYLNGLRCIARYERVFKRGASEDYVHRLAGGNFETYYTGMGTGTASVGFPIGWRGYASENDPSYRFPYYLNFPKNDPSAHDGMIGGGLDYALPGDILVWDKDVVFKDGVLKRIPHVAYVMKADNLAINTMGGSTGDSPLTKKRFFPPPVHGESIPSLTIVDYDFGKYPDVCGGTNWWAVGPERTIYKGKLPGNYAGAAKRKDVKNTDCGNPDLIACVENFWDKVKIYRPYKHVRD